MSRCILVVGPQCCGNAAVAGVLHHLGVNMGERHSDPSEHNPRGYFDDCDLRHLLQRMSGSPFLPDPLRIDLHCLRDVAIYIRHREATQTLWGISLPELCLHGHFLLGMFKELRVIFTERAFDESVSSFMRMSKWPRPVVEYTQSLYWLGQQELCLQVAHQKIPSITVAKAALVGNRHEAVAAIRSFIFDGLPQPDNATLQAAADFVDPTLHHSFKP